jgi:3-oxoacyl-[acyl-carrier-protein] synthase-3
VSTPAAESAAVTLSDLAQQTMRELLRVWFDFERRLARVPIVQRLNAGTFTRDDYLRLLLHMRQQVVEGSRWITRCASSFDREHADVRSIVIGHAQAEHRDYEILERDYVTSGGDLERIRRQRRNPGSEALHGYLMHRASEPNPGGMLGAMWIIEGLGEKMAGDWAARIEETLGASRVGTVFLRYHGGNDGAHMEKLYGLLNRLCSNAGVAADMVAVATVVGRLYALQLEEIDLAWQADSSP